MNKIRYIICVLFFTTYCFSQEVKSEKSKDEIQEAYMKSNKKMIDEAAPMIDFFLKYQDSTKNPSQSDFSKLMSAYGVKNDKKQALSEEQAFSIIDGYIKASEGPKKKKEKEEIDETESGWGSKTEEEKLKEKAEEELPGQMNAAIAGISYEEFKELMLMANPNATETQIKKEYQKLMNTKF